MYDRNEVDMDSRDARDAAGERAMRIRAVGLGVLIGAALGAGAALLMAPSTGADTRRQLRRGARTLTAHGGDAMSAWWDDTDKAARRLMRRQLRRVRVR
jgi:gas vesicle protein